MRGLHTARTKADTAVKDGENVLRMADNAINQLNAFYKAIYQNINAAKEAIDVAEDAMCKVRAATEAAIGIMHPMSGLPAAINAAHHTVTIAADISKVIEQTAIEVENAEEIFAEIMKKTEDIKPGD